MTSQAQTHRYEQNRTKQTTIPRYKEYSLLWSLAENALPARLKGTCDTINSYVHSALNPRAKLSHVLDLVYPAISMH
jgi:hypothetical protein